MSRTSVSWVVAILIVAILGTCSIAAQQSVPTFDVASVKPQEEPMSVTYAAAAAPRLRPGGVFSASHATVSALILYAYNLQPFQLTGGPDWARRDHFEISARAAADASAEQVRRMVQALLEERFKLVVHTEQRDIRFQALVPARPGGGLGPYISAVPDDCTSASAAEVMKKFPSRVAAASDGLISGSCSTMAGLASLLSAEMQAPVIDQTGLSGKFVYQVRGVSLSVMRAANSDSIPNWPSVPVALEEQLGLKLQSRQGLFPVYIIESVQHPTAN